MLATQMNLSYMKHPPMNFSYNNALKSLVSLAGTGEAGPLA